MKGLRERFYRHLRENMPLYIFLGIIFAVGIAFGAITAGSVPESQRLQLIQSLEKLFGFLGGGGSVSGANVAKQVIFGDLRMAAFIWLLGITVVGSVLILANVFFRGFVVGFTVGFLTGELGARGLLLAVAAVLPQNLFFIPALFLTSAAGVGFTLLVLKNRFLRRTPTTYPQFIAYSLFLVSSSVLYVAAGLIAAYISPVFMRLVAVVFQK